MTRPVKRQLWVALALCLLLVARPLPSRASPAPAGLHPTREAVPGGPVYIQLTVLVDDITRPKAEAEALHWLLNRCEKAGIGRLTVSLSAEIVPLLEAADPTLLPRLRAERATIAQHARAPEDPDELRWQLQAWDRSAGRFDPSRAGGTLALFVSAGVVPARGGAELGELLRRGQQQHPEDRLLEELGIGPVREAALIAPPDRILGRALPMGSETAPIGVQAWTAAALVVARHVTGEGPIQFGEEDAALDDLAHLVVLASLTGVSTAPAKEWIGTRPRSAAAPSGAGATATERARFAQRMDEDPTQVRAELGAACSGLARLLDAQGTLSQELTRRLDRLPIDQSWTGAITWPLALEHASDPWFRGAGAPREPAEKNAIRAEVDALLSAVAAHPRVRFVAPGQATQWRPQNGADVISMALFAVPASTLPGMLTTTEVEAALRQSRVEDLRRR